MSSLQTLVISLKHSTERRSKAAQELANTKLDWRFIDAVNGANLNLEQVPYQPSKVKRLLGFEMTPKEIGCYLSHMACWRACVDIGKPTLIFEDDFVIQPHLEEVLETLCLDFKFWDIIRLQALIDSSDLLVKKFKDFSLVQNLDDPLGATAYMVNPRSALQLLSTSTDIFEPLDHFIEHVEKHGLKIFAIKPYPVTVLDPTRATSTITDRPARLPIRGRKKLLRSFHRLLDRLFSSSPFFPIKPPSACRTKSFSV